MRQDFPHELNKQSIMKLNKRSKIELFSENGPAQNDGENTAITSVMWVKMLF
jgi:hypothetical protein